MVNSIIKQFDRFGILPHTLPNAIGMWPNEQECLVWCASQCNPNTNWLEIGSFCGGSTLLLGLTKAHFNVDSKIIAVDNNFNPMFDYNVKKSRLDNIVKIQCDSKDMSQHYNEPISFLFIDGWHSFASILIEYEELSPLLTKDCIVCFHDASPKMYHDQNGSLNKEYITKCYDYVNKNFKQLITNTEQDFRIDEVVTYISIVYGYEIIKIPVRNYETHFKETRLNEWVRGETSPFNSFTAIRKKV